MSDIKRELIKQSFEPIKTAMQEQNLTIYQLAKKAKVNHSTLYCWANGEYKPKTDKIKSICDALNLDFQNYI